MIVSHDKFAFRHQHHGACFRNDACRIECILTILISAMMTAIRRGF